MNLVILLLYIIKIIQGLMPNSASKKRFIPMNVTKKDTIHHKPVVLLIKRPYYSLDTQDISEILQQKKTEGFDHRYGKDSVEPKMDKIEKDFHLLHILQKLEDPSISIYNKKDIAIQFLKDHSDTYSPNPFDSQICAEFTEFLE